MIAFSLQLKYVTLNTVQSQYNAQKAGITSAIVIAVLLPIGICGFCLLLKLRQNAAERREEMYYNDGAGNANQPPKESKPMNYQPNITNSGSDRSSSRSSGKKSKGSSDDRDSGIQTTEVKLHDDGRVTARVENENFQQQEQQENVARDSPISSLKNGIIKPNKANEMGSHHGSASGGSKASIQPSKDEMLLDLENDRGEQEMEVGNPTFNEVVARRSPVGSVGSIGRVKNASSPSVGSGSSSGKSNPRVPLPVGATITSSSDSSNLPSSARSSGRSIPNKAGTTSTTLSTALPLHVQTGPTLIGNNKYSTDAITASPLNDTDSTINSPAQSDARYDGVYYTREPLNDKPKEDFPTKTMDVDIDLSSYKPHGSSRPSAL